MGRHALTCGGDFRAARGRGPCTVAARVVGAGLLPALGRLLAEGAPLVWNRRRAFGPGRGRAGDGHPDVGG